MPKEAESPHSYAEQLRVEQVQAQSRSQPLLTLASATKHSSAPIAIYFLLPARSVLSTRAAREPIAITAPTSAGGVWSHASTQATTTITRMVRANRSSSTNRPNSSRKKSLSEPVKLRLILAGGVVGAVLTLVPVLLPKYEKYLPSASAFGLAWVFNWYYGLLFFLGALIALLLERRQPKLAKELTLPVASGVVAGGSLMGVVLVFWANGGGILKKLLGG